jgi:hypothetical protein
MKLIHNANLVSGVLSGAQSNFHTLLSHPWREGGGRLLGAFLGYPSTPCQSLIFPRFFFFHYSFQPFELIPRIDLRSSHGHHTRQTVGYGGGEGTAVLLPVYKRGCGSLQGTSPMSAVDSHANAGYHGS